MKHMKIEDLEPGDIIKIDSAKLTMDGWSLEFLESCNKYGAKIEKIEWLDHGRFKISFDFIDTNAKCIRYYSIAFYEVEKDAIDVVELS